MNYNTCIKYIQSIPLFVKKSGNNNINELLARLGNPQKKLKIIHIAGTNGKGSICSMLSYIYSETKDNLKVGLFTSPHLIKINERIKINNEDISDEEFLNTFILVKDKVDIMIKDGYNHPSFFELLFVIALVYFNEKSIDIGIIETGLGGRLDVTNLIEKPILSVITQIGLDHTKILGDTIEKITLEKAGIIKYKCPLVVSKNDKNVLKIINEESNKKKAILYESSPIEYKIIKNDGKSIDFYLKNKYYEYEYIRINFLANYQIYNLSTALTAIYVLNNKFNVEFNEIEKGLKKFYWPGRMELIGDNILLDGSHNEEGVKEFLTNIDLYYKDKDIIVLFAVMDDKPYKKMVDRLINNKNIKEIIITSTKEDRSLDPELISSYLEKKGFNNFSIKSDIENIINLYSNKGSELLCCIGSLYLVGMIKKIVGGYYD